MAHCGIYKITNLINGKYYIGQSINIEHRWKNHQWDAWHKESHSYNCYFHRALRKYNDSANWKYEILEECPINQDVLDNEEKFWITALKANDKQFGYNLTDGGQGSSNVAIKLSDEQIHEIYDLLLHSSMLQKDIATKYCVGQDTISEINQGKTRILTDKEYHYPLRKNKKIHICPYCGKSISRESICCQDCRSKLNRVVEWPSREQLKEEIRNNSFSSLGRKYGVNGTAITKWCRKYGLPYRKKDIITYSDEEWKKI